MSWLTFIADPVFISCLLNIVMLIGDLKTKGDAVVNLCAFA